MNNKQPTTFRFSRETLNYSPVFISSFHCFSNYFLICNDRYAFTIAFASRTERASLFHLILTYSHTDADPEQNSNECSHSIIKFLSFNLIISCRLCLHSFVFHRMCVKEKDHFAIPIHILNISLNETHRFMRLCVDDNDDDVCLIKDD